MSGQNKKRGYEDGKEHAQLEALRVSDIVKVIQFYPQVMRVDVLPIVRYPDEDKFQMRPPILSVPVAPIHGGGFFVRPWYVAGDIGVVLYLDRDSDAALSNGAESDPNTERLHSGDDAVFIGGIAAGSRTAPAYPANAFVIGTEDGGVYFAVTKDGIIINGDVKISGSVEAESGDFKSSLKVAGIALETHTHTSSAPGSDTSTPH